MPEGKPLALILKVAAAELAALGSLASDMQLKMTSLKQICTQDGSVLENLQVLDMISQHVSAMSDLLMALAPTLPNDWIGDPTAAAQVVCLADLAHKLSFQSDQKSNLYNFESSDVEMF